MIRAAIIGCGYWGLNIIRNFIACDDIEVVTVCDERADQLRLVREAYPRIRTTRSATSVLRDRSVDAVAIVTPAVSHFELALRAIRAGKHVWIEKPLAVSSAQAARLVEAAERHRRVLFVDHTYVFTEAVRGIRNMVDAGELGRLVCFGSVRSNLGLYRPDVNVLWDLAVHDVSILNYTLGTPRVRAVSATGSGNVAGLPESHAFMTCYLDDGALMHVRVSWFEPEKARTTTITGDRKMVIYDDLRTANKVVVYDRGIDVTTDPGASPTIAYRRGAAAALPLESTEALAVAARHFAVSVLAGQKPITDGEFGLGVVQVIEAAARSMARRGEPIEL